MMGSCAQCLSNPFALSPFSFSHIFLMTPLHLWTRVVLWRAHPGRDVWGEAGLHALVGLLRRLGHSPLTPLSAWASMVCVSTASFLHCMGSVYVCEVLTFSPSLTQWFSQSTFLLFCCVRGDRAKIWLSGGVLKTGLRTTVLTYLVFIFCCSYS